jgi:IMP dehydrogenase
LPVVEEGKIIGIITQKDIDTIEYSERQKVKVKDIMKDQLVTVSTKETLDAAHRKMSGLRVTRLPVMSERGSLVGMITLNDIDRAMKDARTRRFPNPKSLKCPNDGSPLSIHSIW